MALSHDDWREISKFINGLLARQGEYFVQGVVVKNDPIKKLVWLKEFGDQPIPCIAFDYQVKYYYEAPTGNTTAVGAAVNKVTTSRKTKPYTNEVEILVPKVGETVLVAQHLGSRRLPKCLGVIQSTDYVRAGGD